MSMKLSRMDLSAMKVLWFASTSLGIIGASYEESALARILAKLWIRLIGLNSFMSTAHSDFGSKTMKASLRHSKPRSSAESNAHTALMRTSLTVDQQDW